jgi:hypothetical protein
MRIITQRRRLLLGVGVVALLGLVALWFVTDGPAPTNSTVTRENFEKVQIGMPEGEVRKLLGEPSRVLIVEGDPPSADSAAEDTPPFQLCGGLVQGGLGYADRVPARGTHADYYGGEVDVYIYFSRKGVVCYKETRPHRERGTSLWERLLRPFRPGPKVERLDVGF